MTLFAENPFKEKNEKKIEKFNEKQLTFFFRYYKIIKRCD